MTDSGASATTQTLEAHGRPPLFGDPGSGIVPGHDALVGPGVEPAHALAAAGKLLATARRPLVYADGVAPAGAVEGYRVFLRETGLPCVETLEGLGSAGRDHPWYLGLYGSRGANLALAVCDLVVCVGASAADRRSGGPERLVPHARVIRLQADSPVAGRIHRAGVTLGGDLSEAFAALARPLHIAPWRTHCAELRARGDCGASEGGDEAVAEPVASAGARGSGSADAVFRTSAVS